MKRQNLATLVGTFVFLFVMVVYAAYAAISPQITLDNLNINTNIPGGPIAFVAEGANTFNLTIDYESMLQGGSNSVVATASDDVEVSLNTDGLEPICCTYNIVWVWDQTSTTKNQYKISTGATKEYTLTGVLTEKYLASDGSTKTGSSKNAFTDVQVPNYNASALTSTIYSASICNNTTALSSSVAQTYAVTAKFYNLSSIIQDNVRGASFNGALKLANVSCAKKTS